MAPCPYFGIKGVEVLVVVFNKFCEGFVFRFEHSVFQFVVPLFGEGDPFPGSHFTENEGKLEFIRGIDAWVDQEVGVHGFQPSECF